MHELGALEISPVINPGHSQTKGDQDDGDQDRVQDGYPSRLLVQPVAGEVGDQCNRKRGQGARREIDPDLCKIRTHDGSPDATAGAPSQSPIR